MSNGDTLELEQNPVQQENELELEHVVPASDPLDEIQDAEALRAEAKKFRAISSRKEHKVVEPVVPAKVELKETPTGDFLKKSDFELSNQKKAIRTVTIVQETDSEAQKKLKTDLLENWEVVRQFYTPRRGKDTPEDVQDDIMDAYVLFNSRRKPKEAKPDVAELTEHNALGGAGAAAPAKKGKELAIKPSKTPKDWY